MLNKINSVESGYYGGKSWYLYEKSLVISYFNSNVFKLRQCCYHISVECLFLLICIMTCIFKLRAINNLNLNVNLNL